MKVFFNNILKKNRAHDQLALNVQKININTKVEKIFNAILNYSEKSEVRYVGGCIRKILNFENIDDIDLATNISPSEISNIFKKNNIKFFETGIDHGTITANLEGKNFEITSLRRDVSTDGRHAKVEFSNDWYEDASRRDFTINSIYSDIEGNLYDPFNGKKDLKDGVVRFIGDPNKRIKEDYLRILRYVSFFLNYSKVDHQPSLKKIIKQNISGISNISSDRLFDELKKIVKSDGFLKINSDKFCLEILQLIFPQLKNIDLLNKLNNYSKDNIKLQDFIFLIGLMIIDSTDNCEYFLFKFNLSKENKKRLRFLYNIFSKPIEKDFFSEKNLWKILYTNEKKSLIDLINFAIFKSKKYDKKLIELKNFFANKTPPKFPVKAKDLIENYKLKEGRELGEKLKKIEEFWIQNDFKLKNEDIDKIINA